MNREIILDAWLNQVLKTEAFKRSPLAGDASFRRYYRVTALGQSYVVMDAPPPETPEIFVDVAKSLSQQGLSVPIVLANDQLNGFLLLSDFGDRLYLGELSERSADGLYHLAFEALLQMQKCKAELPVFDRAFLERQWNIFHQWYLITHKGFQDNSQLEMLHPIYQHLCDVIEIQPQVFVHRDYHSRNLMILENGGPGILDFQDAMKGPITYDLVSLLQDCYIAWPREQVIRWVKHVQTRSEELGLLTGSISQAEFLRWFDWTGVQRHLKNLGIFARLNHRDGKSGYLNDIPRVLCYILDTCRRYSELHPLGTFLENLNETVGA